MKIEKKHVAALEGAVTLLEKAHFKEVDCNEVIDFYSKLFIFKKLIEEMKEDMKPKTISGEIKPLKKEETKKKKKKDADK